MGEAVGARRRLGAWQKKHLPDEAGNIMMNKLDLEEPGWWGKK